MVLMFAQGCAQVAVDEGEQDVGPVAEEIDEAALDQALNRMIQELESSLEQAKQEASKVDEVGEGALLKQKIVKMKKLLVEKEKVSLLLLSGLCFILFYVIIHEIYN